MSICILKAEQSFFQMSRGEKQKAERNPEEKTEKAFLAQRLKREQQRRDQEFSMELIRRENGRK